MSRLSLIKCLKQDEAISPEYISSEPFLADYFFKAGEAFLNNYNDYYNCLTNGETSMSGFHSHSIFSSIFEVIKRYSIHVSNSDVKYIELRVNKMFLSKSNKLEILSKFSSLDVKDWFVDVENLDGNERVFSGDLTNFPLFAKIDKPSHSYPKSICFKTKQDVEDVVWEEWRNK